MPEQQQDLPLKDLPLKINISLNGCEWVKNVAKQTVMTNVVTEQVK